MNTFELNSQLMFTVLRPTLNILLFPLIKCNFFSKVCCPPSIVHQWLNLLQLQMSKVVTASDECASTTARQHSSYVNMCTRQSSEDMDKHKRDTIYWDLGSVRLMAENFDLKNELTCCLSEMNKLKQDLVNAKTSLAITVSEIERLQEEKCKVSEFAKEMHRKQLEILEQLKLLPEQQQEGFGTDMVRILCF